MQRFVQGQDRGQPSFLPASLEDYVDADNPARVVDAFVAALDLGEFGFAVLPAATGRPSYHPAILLKLYIGLVVRSGNASSPRRISPNRPRLLETHHEERNCHRPFEEAARGGIHPSRAAQLRAELNLALMEYTRRRAAHTVPGEIPPSHPILTLKTGRVREGRRVTTLPQRVFVAKSRLWPSKLGRPPVRSSQHR